jgi:ubiquinone/menaquinone biosynthesis C-methylase UbiE
MSVQNVEEAFHERLVPDQLPWYHRQMYYDHIDRYKFAQKFIKNKKVLDIACGSGYGSQLLAKAGAKKVWAIDISQETIEYAQKRYPHKLVNYKVGRAENIPIKGNSVDIVVSFETLEHIRHHKFLLKEIKRVLKRGGKLIISTPNKSLGTEEASPFHIKEFTLSEFNNLLESNFSDVEIYGQKPIYEKYLRAVTIITNTIPPGRLRWFIDTSLKVFFRGSKVIPITRFRFGFVPSIFVGIANNK